MNMIKKNKKVDETISNENMIKIGTFQLQTKSFWIGLVTILVLFLLSVIWINIFYWHKTCMKLIDLNIKQEGNYYENKN
jgi:hypothetical protein